MRIDVPIVNAFVDGGRGGNPAGVVLGAERFTPAQKQQIAAAVGLSETAFVSPSSAADFKLEFFTPSRQIAHCGHATIATFSYLRQIGDLVKSESSKETIDGCRAIRLDGSSAFMEQLAPSYQALNDSDRRTVLQGLGLNEEDLLSGAAPFVVNTGNAFLVLAVNNADVLARLRVDRAAIVSLSEALDLIGVYVFTLQTEISGRDAGARMFAPRYGIDEEPATGMAAGPLACYLHDKLGMRKERYWIEQGRLMAVPSPSVIEVRLNTADDGTITGLMAGGGAAISETKAIEIAD